MFGLIKMSIALIVIAGIVYIVFFVPFGNETLYDHLVGISKTREAKKLGKEVRKKLKKTKKTLAEELKKQINNLDDDAKKSSLETKSEKHEEVNGVDKGEKDAEHYKM
jgi:hypothetical protein